jgi:hypothetical protein
MTFRVGMKCICVNVEPNRNGRIPAELIKGKIYTVAGLDNFPDSEDDTGIYLEEVSGVVSDEIHANSFKSWRFRPLVERKTDIAIFQRMLNPSPDEVKTRVIADKLAEIFEGSVVEQFL